MGLADLFEFKAKSKWEEEKEIRKMVRELRKLVDNFECWYETCIARIYDNWIRYDTQDFRKLYNLIKRLKSLGFDVELRAKACTDEDCDYYMLEPDSGDSLEREIDSISDDYDYTELEIFIKGKSNLEHLMEY